MLRRLQSGEIIIETECVIFTKNWRIFQKSWNIFCEYKSHQNIVDIDVWTPDSGIS